MVESRRPRWPWGLPVAACIDLHNDGSHPQAGPDALLVPAGTAGEIVKIGRHEPSDTPVYLVDFGGVVLGVLEDEIEPRRTADAPVATP
jgi:nitrogen fixation protein NifZ